MAAEIPPPVSKENVIYEAGFLLGLSISNHHGFTEHDRKHLKIASEALVEYAEELYDGKL